MPSSNMKLIVEVWKQLSCYGDKMLWYNSDWKFPPADQIASIFPLFRKHHWLKLFKWTNYEVHNSRNLKKKEKKKKDNVPPIFNDISSQIYKGKPFKYNYCHKCITIFVFNNILWLIASQHEQKIQHGKNLHCKNLSNTWLIEITVPANSGMKWEDFSFFLPGH